MEQRLNKTSIDICVHMFYPKATTLPKSRYKLLPFFKLFLTTSTTSWSLLQSTHLLFVSSFNYPNVLPSHSHSQCNLDSLQIDLLVSLIFVQVLMNLPNCRQAETINRLLKK